MIGQLARLVADYLGTFLALARTEAAHDLEHVTSTVKRWAFAAVAAVLGLLWLNIALLLWLLQSPWRIGGALAVAVVLLLVAWGLTRSSLLGARGALPHTRELMRAEMHAIGVDMHQQPGSGASATDTAAAAIQPAQPMTPAIARARVRLTRNQIGQLIAPAEPPPPPPGTPRARAESAERARIEAGSRPRVIRPAPNEPGFVPKSRTMRLLMEYWGGQPDSGVVGTVLSSLVGFVALRNRKLRRAAMMVGMARNFMRVLSRRLRRN